MKDSVLQTAAVVVGVGAAVMGGAYVLVRKLTGTKVAKGGAQPRPASPPAAQLPPPPAPAPRPGAPSWAQDASAVIGLGRQAVDLWEALPSFGWGSDDAPAVVADEYMFAN